MKWTIAQSLGPCGACGRVLQVGDTIALLTVAQLRRCPSCAGDAVNQSEVANEQWRIEQEQRARAATKDTRDRETRAFTRLGQMAPPDVRAAQTGDRR